MQCISSLGSRGVNLTLVNITEAFISDGNEYKISFKLMYKSRLRQMGPANLIIPRRIKYSSFHSTGCTGSNQNSCSQV